MDTVGPLLTLTYENMMRSCREIFGSVPSMEKNPLSVKGDGYGIFTERCRSVSTRAKGKRLSKGATVTSFQKHWV